MSDNEDDYGDYDDEDYIFLEEGPGTVAVCRPFH
jgi:hypothetical protein